MIVPELASECFFGERDTFRSQRSILHLNFRWMPIKLCRESDSMPSDPVRQAIIDSLFSPDAGGTWG